MADLQNMLPTSPQEGSPELCGFCSQPKRPTPDSNAVCHCRPAAESMTGEGGLRLGTVPSSAFRPSPRPSLVPPTEHSYQGLEIVSVREKHGMFRKALPTMPLPVAVILCLMNAVLPGTGTLVSAFTVLCGCKTELSSRRQALLYNLAASLLQLLLAPIIVGWVWSVLWGITFVNVSVSKSDENPPATSVL